MSNLEILLIVFIAVTGLAVVIQTGVLLAFYITMKKSTVRLEALANEMQSRAVPALELARSMHGMLQEYRPKLDTLIDNLAETSGMVKRQIGQVDASLTEVLERARSQAAHADELLTRTLERVEDTTAVVQHSLIAPIRQAGGLLQGVTAGVAAFFRRGRGSAEPPENERFY